MKRVILLAFVINIVLTGSASANSETKMQTGLVAVGIKGGINWARMTGFAGARPGKRIASQFGAFAQYNFDPCAGVRFELLYSEKGGTFWASGYPFYGFPEYEFVEKLDYVEFPVMIVYTPLPRRRLSPNIHVGPSIGISVLSKRGRRYSVEQYDRYGVRKTAFGLSFGTGLAVRTGEGQILLELRYSLDLSNIYNYDPGLSIINRNRVLSLSAGYSFR
jgi:hypothetical protein